MYINILPDAVLANPITANITVTDCYQSINRLFLVTMETTVTGQSDWPVSQSRFIEHGLTSPLTQYRLSGRQFYGLKDPTNSIKVLEGKDATKVKKPRKCKQHKIQQNNKETHTYNPLVYSNIMGWLGTAGSPSLKGGGAAAVVPTTLRQKTVFLGGSSFHGQCAVMVWTRAQWTAKSKVRK